jgi:hypothetical protein
LFILDEEIDTQYGYQSFFCTFSPTACILHANYVAF